MSLFERSLVLIALVLSLCVVSFACTGTTNPFAPSIVSPASSGSVTPADAPTSTVKSTGRWVHFHCGPPMTFHFSTFSTTDTNACHTFHSDIVTINGGTANQICTDNATVAVLDGIGVYPLEGYCPYTQ